MKVCAGLNGLRLWSSSNLCVTAFYRHEVGGFKYIIKINV